MNDVKILFDLVEKLAWKFGIIGVILIVVITFLIHILLIRIKKNVESSIQATLQQELQKHQKNLDLLFSEDAIRNTLKIEVGKIGLEKRLMIWDKMWDMIAKTEELLEQDRNNKKLSHEKLKIYEEPFRKFDFLLSRNSIHLGSELTEFFSKVNLSVLDRIQAYIKAYGADHSEDQEYGKRLGELNIKLRKDIQTVREWMTGNMYLTLGPKDYDKSIEENLNYLSSLKPNS